MLSMALDRPVVSLCAMELDGRLVLYGIDQTTGMWRRADLARAEATWCADGEWILRRVSEHLQSGERRRWGGSLQGLLVHGLHPARLERALALVSRGRMNPRLEALTRADAVYLADPSGSVPAREITYAAVWLGLAGQYLDGIEAYASLAGASPIDAAGHE